MYSHEVETVLQNNIGSVNLIDINTLFESMNPHIRLIVDLRPTPILGIYSSNFEGGDPGPFLARFEDGQTIEKAFGLLQVLGFRAANKTLATKALRGLGDQFRKLLIIDRQLPSRPELEVTTFTRDGESTAKVGFGKSVIPPGALVVVERIR